MRLLLVVLFVLVFAPVALAAPKFDLVIKKVTDPPASVAAGDDFVVKPKIKNVSDEPKAGKVTMRLTGGTGNYSLPRRIGRFKTGKIDPKFFKRYTVRLTVPGDQGAGRYRLETCVKAKGQPRLCRRSKRFRITK